MLRSILLTRALPMKLLSTPESIIVEMMEKPSECLICTFMVMTRYEIN